MSEDNSTDDVATDGGTDESAGTDVSDRERKREEASFVEYGIEDKPPMGESALLGFQHYLTMIGATVAIPLALAAFMEMPDGATARLIGTFFVVSGVTTLAQTTIGNRYPLVQGGTFSMLAPAIAIISVVGAMPNADYTLMLQYLAGAVLVAGIFEVFIGYVGLMGWLKTHMGPIVIAPTIALIGLALFNVPQIADPGQNWWLAGLTVVLIVAFAQYLDDMHRAFRLYPVLLGLGSAWVVAAVLSMTGVIAPGTSGYVDFSIIAAAPALQPIYPLQWGVPLFKTSFIIGMFAGMLASVVESFGDYHAVARMAGRGAPSAQRINHGIGMEGFGNVFAGIMMTGNGSTSYTENIGAIGITGVASRYVVQIGAIVMLIAGFVGYVGAIFASIPSALIGGLYIAMFGQIVGVGISNLKFVDLDQNRNVFILGISLFAGLAIPEYMASLGGAAAFQEGMAGVPALGPILGMDLVSQTIFVIGGTGMAIGGLVAFFLDNTISGTREERGLTAWEELTEEDAEFTSVYERYVKGD